LKKIDVVICGAGISGLLLASELSKNLSVLVLEKNTESQRPSKYWLTTNDCLEKNREFETAIEQVYKSMDFITHDNESYKLLGDYILWNSDKICNILIKTIQSNGSKILYDHRFYSFKDKKDHIIVNANEKKIKVKLLIDCMGYSSPLIHLGNTTKIRGYHMLYGKVLKLKKDVSPICISNVTIDHKPHYLEVFPKKDDYAYVALMQPVEKITSFDKLIKDFQFITQKSHYSEYFHCTKQDRELGGIVPVGQIKTKAFNRILFYGEASQMHPAASGTCLTKLLINYKEHSRFILKKINTSNLSSQHLGLIPSSSNNFSQKFQLNIYLEMLKWDSLDFKKFVKFLDCLDGKSLNDFLFKDIYISHFFRKEPLLKIIKSRNYIWLKPFFKSIF